jgi:hypothetical protein
VVEDAPVSNNVAVAPVPRSAPSLAGSTWYASDGSVVSTSDQALRRAVAARQAKLKAQAIRSVRRRSRPAPSALLADFAVFSVTSRTPVREPGGLTISRPRLADVPLPILQLVSGPFGPGRLDAGQIRAIVTRSGARMWVIPGGAGLCLAVLDTARLPSPTGIPDTGAGASCTSSRVTAERDGIGLSAGFPGGVSTTYRVLPRSRPTITVRIGGHERTIRPPFGVYVRRTGHRTRSNVTVVVVVGSAGTG